MTAIPDMRNIAIIAHVDHGKTTLVDALLKQTKVFRDNQQVAECVMDSNAIERERGITIFSKNASIRYNDVKINIIDTPGHADFGGEVERVLRMADGVLLLVDAFDGPMPQTRFVLKKALACGLKVLVVINKIDRPEARPHEVLDEVFDLFVSLNANDTQLDFPVIYASGRQGIAMNDPDDKATDCRALLDAVIKHVPAPQVDADGPLQLQVASIDYNDYVGRIAIGRIVRGSIKERDQVALVKPDGSFLSEKIEQLQIFSGMGKERIESAKAGEIVLVTGIPEVEISDTIASLEKPEGLPIIKVDEPTLTMEFLVNDSPFAGLDGEFVTSRHLRDRLLRELRSNVALRLSDAGREGAFHVSGRGLLHLGILIENMRREGYEFAVGKPHVIFKAIDGVRCEPVEILSIDVDEQYNGKVMEVVGTRKGMLEKMDKRGDRLHLEFRIPSRGLIGLRSRLLNATKGEAVINHILLGYEPFTGEIQSRLVGVLVNTEEGEATGYAIDALQDRGVFFIWPQTKVYEGMIVGEYNRNEDLAVNVCKGKKLSNVRAAGASDRNLEIAPPRDFSMEAALEYLEDDELLEVTPKTFRMRKRILGDGERKRRQRETTRDMPH